MITTQIAKTIANVIALPYVELCKLPIVQNVILCNFSAAKVIIIFIALETNIEKITPIKIIVFVDNE